MYRTAILAEVNVDQKIHSDSRMRGITGANMNDLQLLLLLLFEETRFLLEKLQAVNWEFILLSCNS